MAEARKSNTGLYIGIAAVVIIAVAIGVIMANNGNKGDSGGDGGNNETSQTAKAGLTASDLVDVDDFVDIDEYDKMETVSKAIQNGEMVGKVLQFDGYASHPGTKYSVVQINEAGTQKIGTVFVIEDADESDYPEDGARIFLTGKVVEEEPMVYTFHTVKGSFKVMD